MKNNLSMTRDEQIASILYAVNTLKVRGAPLRRWPMPVQATAD